MLDICIFKGAFLVLSKTIGLMHVRTCRKGDVRMKVICRNNEIQEGSFKEKWVKEAFWHTSAHVLAQAVKRLYPDTKCAIGPAIEKGFYYDFEFSFSFGDEHLRLVEEEMKKIVKEVLTVRVY